MRLSPLLIVSALTCAPVLSAQAAGIDYNYVDVGYVTTDLDGTDEDLDGFGLRGSLEVADNFFLYARWLDQSVSTHGVDFDLQRLGVGGGYAWSFAENMDLYGKLGYTQWELDVDNAGLGEFDDDGYELGVGIRARPLDPFELEGSITYTDMSDLGDDTSLGVAGRWYITDNLALGVEGDFGDDLDTYAITFRWAFGQ